jgi:hypothetical protein
MISRATMEWLRNNLGHFDVTGTTSRAIPALEGILELYSYTRSPGVLVAFGRVVREMPEEDWFLAYHLTAMVMDWDDREPVWRGAGLEFLGGFGTCKFEPCNR